MAKESSRDIDISDGIGIFHGSAVTRPDPMMPFVFGFCCILVTLLVASATFPARRTSWSAAASSPAARSVEDYLLGGLCILITILVWVFILRHHQKERQKPKDKLNRLRMYGVWISGRAIHIGTQEFELRDECATNDLLKSRLAGDDASSLVSVKALEPEKHTFMGRSEASITLQIVNSKYKFAKDWRIAKIHVSKGSTHIHTENLLSLGKPVLISKGVMYPYIGLTLMNQLKIVVQGLMEDPKDDNRNALRLSITPRPAASGASPLMLFGAVGGAIAGIAKNIADRKNTEAVKTAFQKGEFIDQETSDFLLELMEQHEWPIDFRPLGANELGLAGSEW